MLFFLLFFFNDTAPTEIYTLSLHDALPISHPPATDFFIPTGVQYAMQRYGDGLDRKSTRLNSSHVKISYAVFCLKKKIDLDAIALVPYSDPGGMERRSFQVRTPCSDALHNK